MKITQPYCHPGCYWLQPWLPCSALPCSALPCSALPCSALPCSTTVVATLFRKLARRLHPSPQPPPSLKDSLFLTLFSLTNLSRVSRPTQTSQTPFRPLKPNVMPPRAKPTVSLTSRPSRISKGRARRTIRTATSSKSKIPRPRETVAEPSVNSDELSSSDESPSKGSPEPQHQIHHDDLMVGIERTVRDTLTKMLSGHDEKGKERGVTTSTAAQTPGGSPEGTPPPMSVPPTVVAPRNILSHWPWVEKDTIELIANGEFQIDGLPKLHRTDELRNAYLKRSLKGVYQPLEGGPAEVIVGTTKLQSSFKDSTTFFLAWHIYMSIRTTFMPARAAGLINWT